MIPTAPRAYLRLGFVSGMGYRYLPVPRENASSGR